MEEKAKSCCFTGYRPSKFPFLLDGKNREYIDFENKLTETVFSLAENGCNTFYSGMAMGFDIIAAETVLLAKRAFKKVPIKLICAVPFIEQSNPFTDDWKKRYSGILKKADNVILMSDSYYKGCYQKRNEFMVDNSDTVVTWFDGRSGGTKNTLAYAQNKGRKIININETEKEVKYEYYYEIMDEDE